MKKTYQFENKNLHGRTIGTLEYNAEDLLRGHKKYVRDTIEQIRRLNKAGADSSDWYKQLAIAWNGYRKYSRAVRAG